MIGVHIAHDCIIGNNVVIANSAAIAGHAEIEDDVIIGGNCGVQQFSRIGKMKNSQFSWLTEMISAMFEK